MLLNGSILHNLNEVMVLARCGNGMQRRRGGWAYLQSEALLFWHFRALGFLSTFEALRNFGIRALVRLLPAALRGDLYRLFLRKPVSS